MTQQDWSGYVEDYGNALLLFARQYVASTPDAESVVQDAYLRLWKRGTSPERDVKKQLYMYTKSAALDYLRSEGRRRRREQRYAEDFVDPIAFFERPSAKVELQSEVEQALKTLPTEQREVLVMKIWGDMTFREIAEALELSQGTAASRYRLALEALRKSMREEVYYEQ